MNKNIFVQKSKVIKNSSISRDTFLLKFFSREKFYPTQFLMIDVYPKKFLLKPFTVADYDEKRNIVSIIYRIIGEGTRFLAEKKVGEKISFLGPFGNVEKIEKIKESLISNKDYFNSEGWVSKSKIILLAGGSGIASIIYLYKWLSKKINNIKVFYGESDNKFVVDLKKFGINNVVYTTDNGSCGKKGFVTGIFLQEVKKLKLAKKNKFNLHIIQDSQPITIFSCGPKAMLKSLQQIVKEHKNIKCYVLLEEYMCCGVGLCRGCVVKTVRSKVKINSDEKLILREKSFEYKSVCKDGPVFDINEVIF